MPPREPTALRDDVLGFDPFGIADRIAQRLAIPVQPPKDFRVERHGDQVVLIVKDRGKLISNMQVSGADHYDFYWAEDVDTSTPETVDAGAARATKIGDVDRVWIEDRELAHTVSSDKWKNGFFYVFGANGLGDRSDRYLFSGRQSDEILDSTIPANVTDFTISESGENIRGTAVSAIAFQYFAPATASFAGVQFFLENYPNVGMVTEYYVDRYFGPPRGVSTGKFTALPARRVGIGTIVLAATSSVVVTGSGTRFLSQMAVGDIFEAFGVQATVSAVNTDTEFVMTTNWPGKFSIINQTEWIVIGKVQVYAVALSKAGTHGDYRNAPSQSTLFDGELSAPLAPSLAATSMANGIRLSLTPPSGTQIDHIQIYKGKGAGLAFSACSPWKVISQDTINLTGVPPIEDVEFSTYDKEQGQVFSYFATAINVRGTEGTTSARAEAACRLASGHDADPSLPSRDGFKNRFFDAFIGGTGVTVSSVANVVDDSDATQDAMNNFAKLDGTGQPIAPSTFAVYNTGSRLAAWTRWKYYQANQTTVFPIHANTNEVKLAPPGSGAVGSEKFIGIMQSLRAWSAATAVDRKIQKGQYVTLQVKVYCDAGVTPNGTFQIGIYQYNGGSATSAKLRIRNSDDSISEAATFSSLSASVFAAATAANPMMVYATFRLDGALTTDRIEALLTWQQGTTSNLYLKEAMMNDGIELAPWTADMGSIDMYYPVAGNAGGQQNDPPGSRDGHKIT